MICASGVQPEKREARVCACVARREDSVEYVKGMRQREASETPVAESPVADLLERRILRRVTRPEARHREWPNTSSEVQPGMTRISVPCLVEQVFDILDSTSPFAEQEMVAGDSCPHALAAVCPRRIARPHLVKNTSRIPSV